MTAASDAPSDRDDAIRPALAARRLRASAQLLAVIAAAVELVVPLAIAAGVGQALADGGITAGAWVPLVVAIAVAGLLAAAQAVVLTRLAAAEMRRLRLHVAERLTGLLPRDVERLGTTEATALYSTYADALEPLLSADRIRRRTAVVTVAGCLGLMVAFDWRLTLALLGVLAVIGVLVAVVLRPVRTRAARGLASLTETTADLGEFLRSIRSATVFGLRPAYLRRFDRALAEVAAVERQVGRAQATVDLIVTTTSMLLLVGLGAFGMSLVASGALAVSSLSGFIGTLALLLAPAARYAQLAQGFQAARGAEARIRDLPAVAPVAAPPDLADAAPRAGVLDVREAVVAPGTGVRIGPIRLTARPGELVCLVGPSGSGKTSVLSALAGFAELASGQVLLDDRDVRDRIPTELWRGIAYVEQGTPLVGASVREFLTVGGGPAVPEVELLDLLDEVGLLSRLGGAGLDLPMERAGTGLSGGERQRLSLVRALASDRPLVLLDEPTANLDGPLERRVLDAIDRHRGGRVVVVATHSPAAIERADRVVTLGAEATGQGRVTTPPVMSRVPVGTAGTGA
ncbi:ATP-binding cassette domain-containing protein [Clavibacter zhangzhiyongii]|uniref:ATP-binding cassette domain-containing protein n=1 Tax=Clavibacter zhangzhiyongii TaxID=2768071 RepID=UPI0039E1A88F